MIFKNLFIASLGIVECDFTTPTNYRLISLTCERSQMVLEHVFSCECTLATTAENARRSTLMFFCLVEVSLQRSLVPTAAAFLLTRKATAKALKVIVPLVQVLTAFVS